MIYALGYPKIHKNSVRKSNIYIYMYNIIKINKINNNVVYNNKYNKVRIDI